MHLSPSGLLTLAATDLGRFLACRHLTGLDVDVAFGRRPKPPKFKDPFLDLLIQRGLAHEKDYTGKIEKGGSPVLDLTDFHGADAVARTIEAMKAGAPAIAQGALASDGWYGRPDFLQRVPKPSSLGPFSYEAIDTKLSRETKGGTILQLSFYSELLGAVQGIQPELFHVVTPLKEEHYRVADFAAYYRLVKRRLVEASGGDIAALLAANYPEPVDYCDVCSWRQPCDKRRHDDDHLSLVAGITRLNRREFETNGVKTLERLGDLGLPIPFKPAKCSKESLEKAQGQARIQLAGRRAHAPIHELLPVEEGRGLALLPEPSPGDVFLDLEGDHFAAEGPREYLFGMTVLGPQLDTSHLSIWAHTDAEEKAVFETILDRISELWKANPGLHVYHYAPYEPTAFKRLMGRHATRARELDRMLRAELFVDLLAVVKQGLRASVESYSIKKLEEFYGFTREADLHDAGAARRAVEFSLQTGDLTVLTPEVKRLVGLYNEEDCVSALRLRDWLETLRPDVPRPQRKDGDESEQQEQRSKDVQDAMDALLKGVPDDKTERTKEQHARWLLAHMLEFHRREDKVTWWEFYRLRDLTDEDDLLDERAVVSGLKFEKRTPPTGKRAKAPTDSYTYPSQDFEGREGDELFTSDGLSLGTIDSIDRAARRLDVKLRLNRIDDEEPPRWAFAHELHQRRVFPHQAGGPPGPPRRARAPRHPRGPRARPPVQLRRAMESDPILTYAPRRHDGRLGLHQWPAGYPVAYDPDGHAGKGDLCGNCASKYDAQGASFQAWGTVKSRLYFRCGGCKKPVFQAQTGHLSFPIPGFASADGQEGRIRIQLLDGRISRTPLESNASERYRFLVPCHLIYPYFASLTEEGIGPDSAFYEQAMDAMDLHTELRGLIERELRNLLAGKVEEAIKGLCHLRRLQPRHLETTARIAVALEKAGRKAEARWEWEGLGEAFREAGFPEAVEGAREGRVSY